jgi:Stage II sporulation protein E (SpoIIE)
VGGKFELLAAVAEIADGTVSLEVTLVLVRNVIRATGEERWLLNKATHVFDRDGALSLIVSVIEDVTDVKRAAVAQRLLTQAGKELSSSLDYEQTLRRVAQLAVPDLADWCGISMRGVGDALQQVAVAHVDPEKVVLAREFGERYPARLSDPSGPAEVIRSGQAQLVREITEELLVEVSLPDEQLAFVRDLPDALGDHHSARDRRPAATRRAAARDGGIRPDVRSGLPGPRRRARASRGERGRERAPLHRALTYRRNAACSRACCRRRFHRSQGSVSRPSTGQPVNRTKSAATSTTRSRFGGWMVVVGDVAGRGAEAAALTSLSRYTLRTAGKLLGNPVAALGALNAALRERPRLSLVSVCCALLRETNGEAETDIVLAGHPPAYHIHGGVPRPVDVYAPFLGVYDSAGWEAAAASRDPGDQLVLYTDGVIDTVGASERFGEDRLADVLHQAHSGRDAVRRIDEALSRFANGPQADDTAVLVNRAIAHDQSPCAGRLERRSNCAPKSAGSLMSSRGASRPRADVRGQPREETFEAGELIGGDVAAQSPVERHRGVAQSEEGRFSSLGERYHVDATIVRVTTPGQHSVCLHRVQVVGEGRLADSHSLGQLTLIGDPPGLHVEQHEPHRQRAAGLTKRGVEGAADEPCGPGEVEPDGRIGWPHHPRLPEGLDIQAFDIKASGVIQSLLPRSGSANPQIAARLLRRS